MTNGSLVDFEKQISGSTLDSDQVGHYSKSKMATSERNISHIIHRKINSSLQ